MGEKEYNVHYPEDLSVLPEETQYNEKSVTDWLIEKNLVKGMVSDANSGINTSNIDLTSNKGTTNPQVSDKPQTEGDASTNELIINEEFYAWVMENCKIAHALPLPGEEYLFEEPQEKINTEDQVTDNET